MKVTLGKGYKHFYTLEELDMARIVIAAERENDSETPAEWAAYAVNEVRNRFGQCDEVIKVSAWTAKNWRIWNAYEEGSGIMDVWINGLARTANGYLEFGAYLTDIFASGQTPYSEHMYTRFFKAETI